MAEINLNEENIIKIDLTPESTIKTEVPDINYIPGYKVAEEQRRTNELERQAYYEEIQRKVNNGEFNGKQGPKGDTGETGPQGPKGDKGEDGATPDMSNYYNKIEINNMIGDIETLLSEV